MGLGAGGSAGGGKGVAGGVETGGMSFWKAWTAERGRRLFSRASLLPRHIWWVIS